LRSVIYQNAEIRVVLNTMKSAGHVRDYGKENEDGQRR
jgi:hypothetical protein